MKTVFVHVKYEMLQLLSEEVRKVVEYMKVVFKVEAQTGQIHLGVRKRVNKCVD